MHMEVLQYHYCDVIMGAVASQTTSLTIVYSTVYSDADQRKHQSSASVAFVRGIHRGPVNSPHTWPVTRKMFPFDDVIMIRYSSQTFIINSTHEQTLLIIYLSVSQSVLSICTEHDSHTALFCAHDDVIKWKHFPCYWHFVRGIHRSPVNFVKCPETPNFVIILLFMETKCKLQVDV